MTTPPPGHQPPFQPQPWGGPPPGQPYPPQGYPPQPGYPPTQGFPHQPPPGPPPVGYYGVGPGGFPPPPQKHTARNVILAIVGVVVLLFVVAVACSVAADDKGSKVVSTGASAPGDSDAEQGTGARIGDSVEVETSNGTAVVTVSDLQAAPAGSSLGTPNGTLMQVTVVIEVKDGNWSVNPLYFEARTSAGSVVNPDIFNDGLSATDARAGETIRGEVMFDVPAGESLSLIILNGTLFDRLTDWSI